MYLEPLTKLGEMANADDAASQGKQRDMNVDAPLKASAQLAKGSQPCMGKTGILTPKPMKKPAPS